MLHQDRGRQDRDLRRHAYGDRLGQAAEHPLRAIADGARCTWFLTPANPVTARKKWIAGSLEPKGTLHIDAGAVAALRRGASLLPAGVKRVDGGFERGDAVIIRDLDGAEIGRGLVAYDVDDAAKIVGRSSAEVKSILGFEGRVEIVHRDDLVMWPDLSIERIARNIGTRPRVRFTQPRSKGESIPILTARD